MTAAKAKHLIGRLAAKGGALPEEVALTAYRDAAQFALHHPHEDFGAHLLERAELAAWLRHKGVHVVNVPVTAAIPARSADLAAQAFRQLPFRRGDPYRLGLNLSHRGRSRGQQGEAAIGWFIVRLGNSESGEE